MNVPTNTKDFVIENTISNNTSGGGDSEVNFEKTISEGAREIGTFDFKPKPKIKVPLLELSLVSNQHEISNK